ncbi:MAG: superoxide dismutase family protein [Chloroflexota bacterium]|nr:superoxide dismutase family protein [Chloroflexota bacterium]PLS81321.1 MAG: superoxide dismutase [Chloroflexota bacterium]
MNGTQRYVLSGLVAAALALGVFQGSFAKRVSAGGEGAQAVLRNANGTPVGIVKFTEEAGKVLVRAVVHDLPPGFHGFHVHAIGQCIPTGFTSAGGHFNPAGQSHAHHGGDLPVLYVNGDGSGEARFKTDRFVVSDLFDADGSTLIVHALPDNYANIPTRYVPAPDATTLATGDAGGRIACGVVE